MSGPRRRGYRSDRPGRGRGATGTPRGRGGGPDPSVLASMSEKPTLISLTIGGEAGAATVGASIASMEYRPKWLDLRAVFGIEIIWRD